MHDFLVIIHYSAGTIALFSGLMALVFKKGSRLHRLVGNFFVLSMAIMALLGARLALQVPETITVLAGLFTFYLILTSWVSAKQSDDRPLSMFHWIAPFGAISIVFGYFYFGQIAANNSDGMLHGYTPIIFHLFGTVAVIALIGDLMVLVRRKSTGRNRVARHLWRMCFALFIATASLFLGQMQVFPQAVRRIELLAIPVVLVLLTMVFWFVKVLFTQWMSNEPVADVHSVP